jgi:glucokinase
LAFVRESPLKGDTETVSCAVIGIAGPVFGGQLLFQLNIKHWCPIREREVEAATGIKHIVLLNDFVANGYGVLDLDEAREVFSVYEPKESLFKDDQVRVVMGMGTGLGSCLLSRAPSRDPSKPGEYHVNAMEAGQIQMPTFDELDRQFYDYLKKDLGITDRDDVELLLSGSGFMRLFTFYANKLHPGESKLDASTCSH